MESTHNHGRLPNRRLVMFLTGYALGNSGDMFTQIAVLWTGYTLSGRAALSLAGLGGAWTLATAVMGLISGPLIDRFNRRNALIWLHAGQALLSLGLFALAQANLLQMWHLWAYLIGSSMVVVPCGMAFDSLLPDLVEKDRLVRINGLLSSWGMADNMAEAAASGVALAIWGPAPVFLFNGLMYFVGALAALAVPSEYGSVADAPSDTRWHPLADLRITFRYMVREPLLRRYIPLRLIGGLVFACLFFMPPVVSAALGMESEGFGFFQSVTIGGVLAGSLLASSIGTKWPKVKMWLGGQLLYALGLLALGLLIHPVPAFIGFFLFGVGCTGGRIYQGSLYQQIVPTQHRGRIFGIGSFLGGVFQPAALGLAMLFVDRSGVGVVLVGIAAVIVVLVSVEALLLPLHETKWILTHPPSRSGETPTAD